MADPRSPEDTAAYLRSLEKEELVRILMDDAKNWLAHDGLWFQAVEASHGMDAAIDADREAWRRFTVVEALQHRLYARLNTQQVTELTETRAVFVMRDCRVQSARKRKGLPDFPCKSVGVVEYGNFARTIDPRIRTRCVACPPDAHPEDAWCTWEFTLEDGAPARDPR